VRLRLAGLIEGAVAPQSSTLRLIEAGSLKFPSSSLTLKVKR
jgi:hypothetical protein